MRSFGSGWEATPPASPATALVPGGTLPPVRALPFELSAADARRSFLEWAKSQGALESAQPFKFVDTLNASAAAEKWARDLVS